MRRFVAASVPPAATTALRHAHASRVSLPACPCMPQPGALLILRFRTLRVYAAVCWRGYARTTDLLERGDSGRSVGFA